MLNAIVQRFGEHNVLPQYGHQPPPANWWQGAKDKAIVNIRQQVWPHRYVVGHVPVSQYMDAQGKGVYTKRSGHRYMTFLRNPLDRAVSHYFYWHQINEPQNPQWLRFHTEQWTLEEFLLKPDFTNFHMRFTRGLDIDDFDFVGVVEAYAQSMHVLGCLFPEFQQLPILQSRQNVHKDAHAIEKVSPQVIDEFTRLHHIDIAMYEYARERVMRQAEEYAYHRV